MRNKEKLLFKNIILSLAISVYSLLPNLIFFISFNRLLFILAICTITFFVSRLNKILFILINIYFLLCSVIIFHLNFNWGKTTSLYPFIEIFIYSPKREIKEYLINYLNFSDLGLLIYLSIGFYMLHKINKTAEIYFNKKYVFTGLLIIFSTLLYLRGNIFKIMPLSIIHDIKKVISNSDLYIKRNQNISQNTKILKNTSDFYQNIVIVLGESANKNYMGLYNTELNTTPFLSSLNLTKLNAISPAAQTHLSIPLTFTEIRTDSYFKFFESKSIITDFKEHNYNTLWLSNQEGAGGLHESTITSISKEADSTIIKNFDNVFAKPDEVLLDDINSLKTNKKQLFVVHLMGSHMDYSKRYPKENALINNPKKLEDHYVNSIYYTDYVLKKIFKIVRSFNEKFLFVYISDHGETIMSNKGGHGHSIPFKETMEIPFILYSSIYNKRIEEIDTLTKGKIINNESFYDIISYITFLNDKPNLSFSKNIISLSQKSIFNYDNLIYANKK